MLQLRALLKPLRDAKLCGDWCISKQLTVGRGKVEEMRMAVLHLQL